MFDAVAGCPLMESTEEVRSIPPWQIC
ncbi:hypothetical protein A2U01_0108934, partial [Trifolium medium]|nr:hypothetical protein [Trifolium medium]